MAIFGKKDREQKKPLKESEVAVQETAQDAQSKKPSSFQPVQESVITGFYVSEKAGLLNGFNQYVFKVSDNSNKSQLSRQVEKMFNVKVKSVKMMNTKKKRRDIGRYTGFKPGFKKAVVVLEKGHVIEQAKA